MLSPIGCSRTVCRMHTQTLSQTQAFVCLRDFGDRRIAIGNSRGTSARDARSGSRPSLQRDLRARIFAVFLLRPVDAAPLRDAARVDFRHSSREAILAPCAIAASFAHVIFGSTVVNPAKVENPQSLPAITFSRPAIFANLTIRSATSSG